MVTHIERKSGVYPARGTPGRYPNQEGKFLKSFFGRTTLKYFVYNLLYLECWRYFNSINLLPGSEGSGVAFPKFTEHSSTTQRNSAWHMAVTSWHIRLSYSCFCKALQSRLDRGQLKTGRQPCVLQDKELARFLSSEHVIQSIFSLQATYNQGTFANSIWGPIIALGSAYKVTHPESLLDCCFLPSFMTTSFVPLNTKI